jgi:hypothetical protein
MARGHGRCLTGLITSLVAQKYEPTHAAVLGVYLHGAAADLAASHECGINNCVGYHRAFGHDCFILKISA